MHSKETRFPHNHLSPGNPRRRRRVPPAHTQAQGTRALLPPTDPLGSPPQSAAAKSPTQVREIPSNSFFRQSPPDSCVRKKSTPPHQPPTQLSQALRGRGRSPTTVPRKKSPLGKLAPCHLAVPQTCQVGSAIQSKCKRIFFGGKKVNRTCVSGKILGINENSVHNFPPKAATFFPDFFLRSFLSFSHFYLVPMEAWYCPSPQTRPDQIRPVCFVCVFCTLCFRVCLVSAFLAFFLTPIYISPNFRHLSVLHFSRGLHWPL